MTRGILGEKCDNRVPFGSLRVAPNHFDRAHFEGFKSKGSSKFLLRSSWKPGDVGDHGSLLKQNDQNYLKYLHSLGILIIRFWCLDAWPHGQSKFLNKVLDHFEKES